MAGAATDRPTGGGMAATSGATNNQDKNGPDGRERECWPMLQQGREFGTKRQRRMPSGTCCIHGCWCRWRTHPVSMAHHHPAFALPNSQQSAAWAGEAQQANASGGHDKNEDRRLQVLQGNAFSGGAQVLVSVLAECMKGEANGTSQKRHFPCLLGQLVGGRAEGGGEGGCLVSVSAAAHPSGPALSFVLGIQHWRAGAQQEE